MSVHYKFKSALDFDTITFDGLHISVSDLKKAITHQKRLGKAIDFDLQITNAQTKEVYSDNSALIPKNTSLIIARVPLIHQPKKSWEIQAEKSHVHKPTAKADSDTLDLSLMNGSEEDKINAMMMQSTVDYDPKGYQKLRGQSQTGDVPANYRCFRCHKPGHWIKNCPLNLNKEHFDVKRNTGIPRSFRQDKELKESQEKTVEEPKPPPPEKQEIPEDLLCNICKDLFTDAVMIPCCGSSFCDDCVRTALLESEDNECPDCKEKGSSPGSLIPNRFLRNSVNAFKNETGYDRPPPKKSIEILENGMEDQEEANKEPTPSEECANLANDDDNTSEIIEKTVEPISKEMSPEPTEKAKMPNVDGAAHSSHDESDFEDNITVTVPPAYMQSHGPHPRDRTYNGSNSRRLRSTGIENSPRPNYRRTSPTNEHQNRNSHREIREQPESTNDSAEHEQKHHIQYYQQRDENIRPHRPPMYMQPGPPMSNVPQNMHGHIGPPIQKPPFMDMCGPHPGYPPFNRPPQFMGPGPGPRPPSFMHMGPMRPRHIAPPNLLAAVYKNVAEKVGTGIIDDPLEAFNRLMKERENRQEQRRRSPERQRSRSIDRNFRGQFRPGPNRRPWNKSPERGRSPVTRSKERSPDRIRERRRHNSSSMSDRSSRSRSPPKYKRSKSVGPKRRSCSRSPSFRNRSRSRSNSRGRFRGPPTNYVHSPRRSISPRYRQEDFRASNRYPQEDARHPNRRKQSPLFNNRRPRSRARSPMVYYRGENRPENRQENRSENRSDNRLENRSENRSDNKVDNRQDNRHQSRDHQRLVLGSHQNQQLRQEQSYDRYSRDRRPTSRSQDQHYESQMNVLGDMIPETEPPPPGYENMQLTSDKRNKLRMPTDDHHSNRNQYQSNEKNEYVSRGYTPDPKGRRSEEKIKKREFESWDIECRSESFANKADNKRRKFSQSPSPLKQQKSAGHLLTSKASNNQIKGRNREPPIFEQNDRQVQRHEKDHSRHDREDRKHEKDVRVATHTKDVRKVPNDRSVKDSDNYNTKDDKDRVRNKPKDLEDKPDDPSLELEQKIKKVRDKKKKKKDKDDKEKEKEKEKKKLKKEKKEKKEREKDKNRETCPEPIKTEIKINSEMNVLFKNESIHQNISENLIKVTAEEHQQIPKMFTTQMQDTSEIDLYKDICNDENLENVNNMFDPEEPPKFRNSSAGNDNEIESLQDMKMFDSVLDIHDFESNIDEFNTTTLKPSSSMLSLPGASKWEREDEHSVTTHNKIDKISMASSSSPTDEKSDKITTEVLRRAENAIFARAINAIRPIEIKKISADRQKLYSTDRNNLSPTMYSANQSLDDELKAFQITVPVNNTNSSERSVEIRTEHPKRESTPCRSIKARLGQKVSDSSERNRSKSRSVSTARVVAIDNGKDRSQSNNRDHYNYKDDKREIRLTVTNKPDNNRSRDRDKPTTRDIHFDRNRIADDRTDSTRSHDRERGRERERDRHPEVRKPRNIDRPLKDYPIQRNMKQNIERSYEGNRNSRFERSDNSRDKRLSPHRSTSQSLRKHESENKRHIVDDRNQKKRPRSPIKLDERSDKKSKQDKEDHRHHNTSVNQADSQHKSTNKPPIDNHSNEQEKSPEKVISSEKPNEKQPQNTNSSSSSSSSDTSSETDEQKNKKKRKHKSKKKRSKSESQSSPKSRHHKSKKKSNKSAKKKKAKK